MSFEAAPGEFLAIVGPTGSGKTTVADLLMRYYTPRSGLVAVNASACRTCPRTSFAAW